MRDARGAIAYVHNEELGAPAESTGVLTRHRSHDDTVAVAEGGRFYGAVDGMVAEETCSNSQGGSCSTSKCTTPHTFFRQGCTLSANF